MTRTKLEIIDHTECEICEGEGEIKNESFQNLSPLERLVKLEEAGGNNEAFDTTPVDHPFMPCPFCTDGQAPIYACEDCDGTGIAHDKETNCGYTCQKCDGQGGYL